MAFRRDNFDKETLLKRLDRNCKDFGIITRPNAGNGFWLTGLLPAAYIINTSSHKYLHFEYKLSTIICFCLFLQSIEIIIKLCSSRLTKKLNYSTKLLPGAFCAFLVWICLGQSIVFCLLSGYLPTFLFNAFLLLILKKLPKSFTIGEACVLVQGYVIFLYNAFLQVPYYYNNPPITDYGKLTAISVICLLGVSLIIGVIYLFSFLRKTALFYCFFVTIALTIIVFPVTKELPIIVVLRFLFKYTSRICYTNYLIGLVGVTGCIVWYYSSGKRQSSTIVRKTFHILMILVYVPGFYFECTYLYFASTIVLCAFVLLETARIIKLYPISSQLQTCIKTFVDEKDSGKIAFTPLYLLGGCSMPLWLHHCPCDVTDSAGFEYLPLISGVLSIGIGDTAASIFGSKYGKHKIAGSSKTIEGTIANIVAQFIFLILLAHWKLIELSNKNILISIIAVITTAITEAKTDQIDNLVLPIISFIFLSL